MKSRFALPALIASLAVSATVITPPAVSAPAVSQNTVFQCVPQGSGVYGTLGRKGSGTPIPLILWTPLGSSYFGGNATPQNRCQIVTKRINSAVAANGGSLKNVLLTNGTVNNESVICVLSPLETRCHQDNILFSLNPSNAWRANEILAQIMQISRNGNSAGIIFETSGRTQVNLGDWEKVSLGADNSDPVTPQNSVTPENSATPQNPATPDNGGGF